MSLLASNPRVNPLPLLTLLLSLSALWNSAQAADWPNLRGPTHDSMSSETDWKASDKVPELWKSEVGLGYSAVVVADGRAYTTGHNGSDTDTIFCFDALTGEVLWKHSYPHPLDDLYFQGGTTGTPTVEGEVVYSVARRGQLFCLDAKTGAVRWQKHLTDDFGCKMPDWGFTGAPRIHGDLLLLAAGEAGLALKKEDGSVAWKSEGKEEAGYAAPYLFERDGRILAIFSNADGYTCVDPETGASIWFYKQKTRYGVNATEPVVWGDHVFLSTGYGKGASLLEWKGSGEPEEIWRSRDMCNQMNPSLLIDGYLYGIDGNEGQDRTGLKCLEMKSGEIQWLDESLGHGATIAANGQLIALSEAGELLIGPISPASFEPTFRQQVVAPKCWTIPILANGILYCRNSRGDLVALDLR